MAQADEKRKALYDAIKGDYDVGTYEEYNKKMDDPNKRKALYDAIKGDYDVGDWASFDSKLAGTTQAQEQPTTAVDDAVQANQANLPEQQPQQPQQETNPFRSWLSEQLQDVQNANPLDWLHKAAELQTEQEKQQAAGQQQPQQTAAQQTSGPAFGSEEWKAQQEAKINQGIANFDAQSQAQLASFKQTQENKQRASKAIGGVAEVGQRLNPETGEVEKLYTDDMTGAVYGNKATAQMAQQTEQNRQQRLDYANGQLANLNEQLATAQAQLDMFNENVAENPYASIGGHRGGLSLTRQRKELERNVKNINQAIEQTKAQITNLNNMIDPSIEGQIIRVQEAREATLRQIEALRKRDEERWREYQRENPTLFIGQSGRGRAYSRAPESEEIQALRQAVRNYDKAIVGLQNQQKRENGESDGFWDHFKQGVNSSAWERSQYGFWQNAGELLQGLNLDYGISDLNRVALMMHADEIPEHATEGEKKAYGELMQSQAVLQDVNNLYGQYTPALGRYGDIFSQMPGFMVPFITTAGWADALKIGDQAAIRGLNKLFGKAVSEKLIADATADATKAAVEKGLTKEATDALVAQAVAKATRQGMEAGWAKEAAEKGIIASIKDPEIGAGKTAATWLMRGLGQAADDVAMAGIRINTVAAPSTVAQAIDYRLGDVVLNDDGTYSFEKGKSWGEALSLAEMDNLVEFYSEALGFRYGGLLSLNRGAQLAGNVGLKRLSNFLSRADGSTYHKFWGDLNNLLGKAGVNDITEEVAEEYAGQYWRSILGLETAYTTDEEGNPVNLALTGQFHGDIWGGMVCSIGLMSAMKHGWSAGRYYYLNHKLNKADMVASELLTRSYGSIYNPLTKEREQRFAGVGWGAIKYAIDNTSNANMGLAAEAVIVDPTLTNAQKEAIMNYMTYLIEMRGYNLAGVRGELPPEQTEGMTADQTAVAKMLQGQATANYISGYESDGTPQDAVDARVRRDMKRDALVSLLGEDVVDQIDQDPMAMLRAMASDKLRYGDNEMDAVIDYINAKMAVDGMIRRESDDMDDQVAQSDAMIDQRTNFDTGKVQEATMKDNRKVYVVRGNVVRNEDGTINTQASDDTLVVRDDKTGQLEMVAPSALLSVDSEQDPTQLKEAAANTIRQQAMEQAQAKLNNQLPIQQGDTFDYVDENGNPTRVMVVPNADGVIDNGDGTINVTVDGQNVFPISIQFLRQQAEQLAQQHSQDYDEAQRQQKEQEQQENEEQPQAQAAGEVVEEQPAPQEEASQEDNTIENNEESQASAELREATQQPKSALEQIPVDEQGNPIYEQSTPQLAWDALVEQTDGDENEAKEVVDTMVENKKAALKEAQKAQKKKATGTTIAEIIDERNERKAAVAQAQSDLDFWNAVAGVQAQRDIDAAKAAQNRSWTHEDGKTARAHGKRIVNGQEVNRQEEGQPHIEGKKVTIRFATRLSGDVEQDGHVAIIDAKQLQPSHLDGERNPLHFLPEAQPKKREGDSVSRASATKMAQEMEPRRIVSDDPYFGAPVINTRGEVIQGNNRSAALKQMWEDFPEKAAEYKEYLKEHAAEFGLTAEQIDQMENPVLVSMVDVDDDKAIELGQYTARDNESGGKERISPIHVTNLMQKDNKMQNFADLILKSDDEDAKLSDLIKKNGAKVLEWMKNNGFISDNQYNSAIDSRGHLTSGAENDLTDILRQRLFGGDSDLQGLFEELPPKAQRAVLEISSRINTANGNEAGLLEEIRDSIRAFHDMSQEKAFSEAKTYDDARKAVEAYRSQTSFDYTGKTSEQGKIYSNLATELAALYKNETIGLIRQQLNKLVNLMRGIQDDMFGNLDTTPRTLAQAVKEVLNIDYNGQFGSGILGSNATTDTRGQQGSSGNVESRERNQGEEGPEVDRGGVEGNSEQGGGVTQEENPTNNSEVSTNQEENPNPENNETRNSAEETPNNGEESTNEQQQPLTQGQQRYNNFVEKVRDLVKKLGNVPVRMATSSQELLAIARQMDNDAIANGKRGGLEAQIRQLFARGRTTRGFVNNGQVVIFAEGIYDLAEGSEEDALQTAREVLAHEVIAHVGLRQLMDAKDKEGHRKRRSSFKKFCDDVFKGMTAENRSRFLAYHWNTNMTANARLAMLNTALADDAWWQSLAQAQKEAFATQAQWDNLTLEQKAAILAGEQSATALRQGAADEYVASLAEKVERGEELTEPEQSVWQRIIDAIKRFFGAATVEGLTPQQIAQYLQESREFLQNEAQNGGEAQLLGEEEARNNEENPQFSVEEERVLSDVQGQKQVGVEHDLTPAQMQEMDNLNDEVRFSSKEDRLNRLGGMIRNMRPDMNEEQRNTLLDYVEGLRKEENGATMEIATLKWYLMGNIRIPEDMPNVRQAVAVGKKAGVDVTDIKEFPRPMAVINAFPQIVIKEPPINPNEVDTLTNKKTYPHGITVYDVENSYDSRMNMRHIIDTHLGEDHNPWCLLESDGYDDLTTDSEEYWYKTYTRFAKKVAFQNGKLIAFFAAGEGENGPTWWDVQDSPHEGIPVTIKLEDGRTATMEYNIPIEDIEEGEEPQLTDEDYWKLEGLDERIDELNSEINLMDERIDELDVLIEDNDDRLAELDPDEASQEDIDELVREKEEWEKERAAIEEEKDEKQSEIDELEAEKNEINDSLNVTWDDSWRNGYEEGDNNVTDIHKGNKKNGDYTEWWDEDPNHIKEQAHYKDGKRDGAYELWYSNGQLEERANFKDGKKDGAYESWYFNGQLEVRGNYKEGKKDGVYESWYFNGQLAERANYKEDNRDGVYERYYENGQLRVRVNYKEDNRDGIRETWYENGQLHVRGNYKEGKLDGAYERYYENGQLEVRANYKDGKKVEDLPLEDDTEQRNSVLEREGNGELSDDELSAENDAVSKAVGYNVRTAKQRKAMATRLRREMRETVEKMAKRLHLTDVDILDNGSGLTGALARSKGFYNQRTGKITIIIGNNSSLPDVVKTVLHEAVAHHGLRQLFGTYFDEFLDNVYKEATKEIRHDIAELAARNDWNFRRATEEYLAELAERMDEDFIVDENGRFPSWWTKVKKYFYGMLNRALGGNFRNIDDIALTDNELRYILWSSYDNLRNPNWSSNVYSQAADIAMRYKLGISNYNDNAEASIGEQVANANDILMREGEARFSAQEQERQDIIEQARQDDTLGKAPNGAASNLMRQGGEQLWATVRTPAFKNWFGDWENDAENSSKVVDENGEPKVVYHGSRTGGEFSTFEGTTFFTDNRDVADMFRQEGAYLVRVNGHEPMMMDGRDVEELAEYLTQGDYDAKELADWGKLSKELLQESMEELLKYEQQNIKDILRLDEDEELTGLSIKETAPVFEVFLNIRNPEVMDFNNTVWTVDNAPERGEREAKDTGHDGMVINNIVEGGYAAELLNGDEVPPATDYVVFNPNQVKSIDNNGNFSSVDNDIRFSTEEAQQRQEAPQHEDLFAQAERIARDYEQQYENERRFSSVVYPRVLARDAYERRMRSSMFQTVEAMQDSMRSLFEATKAILGKRRLHIENLPEYQNAYIGENALSSVNQAEAEMVARQLFAPLLQEIARLAPSETENRTLIDYMMAKHGLERNAYMAERDAQRAFDNYQKKNPNGGRTLADFINEARQRDYAGLTALTGQDNVYDAEAVAEQMVDDYESKHNTTVLWQRTRAVTDAILQKQYDSGLMTRASFDHIMGMYQNYIPLRGFDETTSDEVYAYLMSRGSGMASVDKVAKGRESKADDPIANLQAMMENAIMRGNRNVLVKQRFMNFAMNHPSDLISISDLWLELNDKGEWIPQFPDIKDGDTPAQITQKCEQFEQDMQAKAAADPDRYVKQSDRPDIPYKVVTKDELKEHQVIVSRGGRDYVLTVNGNPRLAQAINGKTNPDNDNFLGERVQRVLGSINRALSAFYTTRNPDFIISNFFRDMIYSNTMTHVKEKGNYAKHYNVNYARTNPAMMNILLTRFRHGTLNMGNEMDRLFYEFMSNGGETGYASVRDIDAHKNEIQRELKKYAGRMPVGKALDYLGARFDELNRSVELCARFAAFVTSRQMGRTIGRAVYDAKEVSVNFNKKGAGGTFYKATGQTRIGNWAAAISAAGRLSYVFWNAGMQGMTNFGRQFGRHPAKAIAAAATMYTLGALVSHLGNMGGGDGDDDDNNAYWNLPDYLRRTNILFRTGDYWISIPLPIEFRAFYGMGELMTSLMYGREYKDGWGVASEVASQLTQVLPLDFLEGAGGFKNFIPSSLKPLAEAALFNVSWSGTPLQRETPWNQDRPQYTKAWKSANQYIVGMAEWLNRISGGNDKQQGKIDVSPAKIEYILSGYFGGVFNTINELTKMGETAIGKRDFDPRNFMLLTRILRTGDTGTKNRGVENEYWRIRNNADELKRKVREYEDALNSPNENTREHAEKEGYQKALDKILNSMEWKEVQVFEDYRKELNAANRAVKNATDDEERAENDMEFTKLKREMLEAVRQMRQNKKKAEENEEEE